MEYQLVGATDIAVDSRVAVPLARLFIEAHIGGMPGYEGGAGALQAAGGAVITSPPNGQKA